MRGRLADGGRPYAGSSAGGAVAAETALVGGWRSDGVAVCPEDAAEDLDDVTVTAGLGLVPWLVDVHCALWVPDGSAGGALTTVRSGAPLPGALLVGLPGQPARDTAPGDSQDRSGGSAV